MKKIIPVKKKKIIVEKPDKKKIVKEIKEPKKSQEVNLEKQIIIAGDMFDSERFRETLRIPKTPVLERIATPRRRVLEEEVPITPAAEKKDDVKYGAKVEYGTTRDAGNKDAREIRYQTATEYVTGREEKRKFQEGEAFDPTLTTRNEKRDKPAPRIDFASEYEVKKKKYE